MWWRRGWHGDSDAELDDAHLMRLAGRFAHRARWAKANGVPVIDCKAGERKHRIAGEYLAENTVSTGVFMILVARARATVWKVKRSAAGVIMNLEKKAEYVNHPPPPPPQSRRLRYAAPGPALPAPGSGLGEAPPGAPAPSRRTMAADHRAPVGTQARCAGRLADFPLGRKTLTDWNKVRPSVAIRLWCDPRGPSNLSSWSDRRHGG